MLIYVERDALLSAMKCIEIDDTGGLLLLDSKLGKLFLKTSAGNSELNARIEKAGCASVDYRSFYCSVSKAQGMIEILKDHDGKTFVRGVSEAVEVREADNKIVRFEKRTKCEKTLKWLQALVTIAFAVVSIFVLCVVLADRLKNELTMYNMDVNYYLGIGRAITRGYRLYSDMFDIKPPGIFYTSAISYILSGGPQLALVFSFIALLITGFVPVIITTKHLKKTQISKCEKLAVLTLAVLFGGMIIAYVHVRAGHLQTECFGACFASLYLLMIYDLDVRKLKPWSPIVFLIGFVLMISPMYKEPFAFIAAASALLLVRNPKELLFKIILPAVYGALMGVLLLFVSGNLDGYLNIYLYYMLTQNMTNGAIPAILRVDRLLVDFCRFSPVMGIITCASLMGGLFMSIRVIINGIRKRDSIIWIILLLIRIPLLVIVSSMMVGSTGAYFGHHFVFAVPAVLSLAIMALEGCTGLMESNSQKGSGKRFIGSMIVIATSLVMVFYYPTFDNWETGLFEESEAMQREAEYVDEVLDRLGEDRYQFFGFNGQCLNYKTEHIPMGPVFVQDWMKCGWGSYLGQLLWEELDNVNVMVIQDLFLFDMTEHVQDLIDTEFTDRRPIGIEAPPEDAICKMYYRKSAFTF